MSIAEKIENIKTLIYILENEKTSSKIIEHYENELNILLKEQKQEYN